MYIFWDHKYLQNLKSPSLKLYSERRIDNVDTLMAIMTTMMIITDNSWLQGLTSFKTKFECGQHNEMNFLKQGLNSGWLGISQILNLFIMLMILIHLTWFCIHVMTIISGSLRINRIRNIVKFSTYPIVKWCILQWQN